MSNLLSAEKVEKKLEDLDVKWSVVGEATLSRVYEFDDFKAALKFVNEVADKAEAMNHHPNIELSYGKVVVNITTHNGGGLTEKDFELAAKL